MDALATFFKYAQYVAILPQILGALANADAGENAEFSFAIKYRPKWASKDIHYLCRVSAEPDAKDVEAAHIPKKPKPTPAPAA